MSDAYRVLNVSPTASIKDIRSAYVELACEHHPCNSEAKVINSSGNHTQFRLIAEAFYLVGDDLHRELYDLIRSTSALNKSAQHYRPNLDGFSSSQARLAQPTRRRSRASSELTIDLRFGLPPELRALLVELDPIKLFNRVVNQIDQERRLKQHAKVTEKPSPPVRLSPSGKGIDDLSNINPKSKYLSPSHGFLDEAKLQPSRSCSPSKSTSTREDAVNKQQKSLNFNSKPGILRDESKSQFKQPLSNLTESLKRDQTEMYRSITSEFQVEPNLSRGNSRNSSYLSNTGSSSRSNRSRRVSFSNDVIESDELKQAREVVKSFKSEMARKSSKPLLPSSNSQHPPPELSNISMRGGLVNKHGFSTSPNKTSPPSYMKTPELFSDNPMYRDPDQRVMNPFWQEILAKPITIEKASSNVYRSHLDYGDKDNMYCNSMAASAPTGYLAKYREEYADTRNGRNLKRDIHESPSNRSPPFADRKVDPLQTASRSPRRDLN